MENKQAMILVLATLAAVVIATSATYAMGGLRNPGSVSPSPTYRSGMGPSMMGGSVGYAGGMTGGYSGQAGGMMGGYGMMGNANGAGSMYEYMEQYMSHYWNSTSTQ